uniref:Glycoside hydrolase 131 catalytic N-terminal domain-containing protein n=1 Tax=Colletotrichum fructicola (strain Nara gc5) TaxID=1213859 RepID=L2FKI0_COLFN
MILPHLAVRALSASVQCPVVLDGRISQNFTLENFDTNVSPYNPGFTKGSDPWSKIILFPTVPTPSRFDAAAPAENPQLGFRRAGLLLGNGSDASNQGVMTFHWSAMQDSARKLNLTHEYLTSFHETNDSGGAQFALQVGLPLGQNGTEPPKENWKMLDRNNSVVFTTPLKFDTWQNWAVTLDVPQNTMQVFFSEGNEPLKAVTKVLPNNNAGGGALQIGMLKKPTETKTVANDGFQESNLSEGQILGGIFVENSANGCISL